MTDPERENLPARLPDGRIRAQVSWHGPDGAIGCGVADLTPDDPEYAANDAYLRGVAGAFADQTGAPEADG